MQADTMINRIRTHLMDERIDSVDEADAEMMLMTHVELVEVISFVLEDMMAGRPTRGLMQVTPQERFIPGPTLGVSRNPFAPPEEAHSDGWRRRKRRRRRG